MADTAVLLNISEMIDMAIGSPEVGVVDFNMLQTVLHCLAQQLRVLGKNVEMRGSLLSVQVPRDNVQTINIKEYAVDTDKTKKDVAPPPPPPPEETILVVERIKKSDSPTSTIASDGAKKNVSSDVTEDEGIHSDAVQSPGPAASPKPQAAKTETRPRAISHTPAPVSSTERLSLVTISKFNVLENTVADLKNRVYGSMPKNEEILEEVRSQSNIKAISDLWTNLNVSSRLEAAEAGMAKLSSLVQDLINETSQLQGQTSNSQIAERLAAASAAAQPAPSRGGAPSTVTASRSEAIPAAVSASGTTGTPAGVSASVTVGAPTAVSTTGTVSGPGAVSSTRRASTPVRGYDANELAEIQENVDQMRAHLNQLTETFYTAMKEIQPTMDLPPQPVSVAELPVPTAQGPTGGELQSQSQAQRSAGVDAPGRIQMHGQDGLHERVINLERRLKDCCDKIGKNEDTIQDHISSFQDQLDEVVKQVAVLSGNGSGGISPDLVKDLQGLMQLFQTVQDMQEQLKKVHETALQLASEKEDRQSHVNALLEQIELLKNIKLDREDMVEAMSEKADLRMLARKVSHDQFEMACDGLSRGLEHALGKLNMQESLWQQALDDIQREIETKLDKMELSPVKDFFNDKLKQLQENLKQMASLRREAEAAGTKRKLLRDVNCISCDANAVMAMEAPSAIPLTKPLPATLSMKPYLSYELDAIRKTQASHLPQRNMHDWENIDKQLGQPNKPLKVRSEADKHMCNRYCGGSHTTTTPAQRVARLGHFIKQWGPDVLPLSSGLAAGDDGRMYRVTPNDAANNAGAGGAVDTTCTPRSPSKPELPKLPERPTIITECKCLEAPGRSNGSK